MQNIRITPSPVEMQYVFFFFLPKKPILRVHINIEVRRRSECKNMVLKKLHEISLVSPCPVFRTFRSVVSTHCPGFGKPFQGLNFVIAIAKLSQSLEFTIRYRLMNRFENFING